MKKILSASALFALVLSGCVPHKANVEVTPLPESPPLINTIEPEPQARIVSKDIYQNHPVSNTEVVREGRYTLVSIAPDDGQKFLLEQIVSVTVPQKNKKSFNASVEQGLRSTLKNTGLELCYASDIGADRNVATLFSRQLPKVHYKFGPIKLYEALQMIAGPAYEMTLNDISRTICFKTRSSPASQQSKPLEVITTTTTEIVEE